MILPLPRATARVPTKRPGDKHPGFGGRPRRMSAINADGSIPCCELYHSPVTCLRRDFCFARCFFVSSMRLFCARDFGLVRRRSASRNCCAAVVAVFLRASSFSHSSSHANRRLAACDRSRWQRTSTPVGECRNQTVDDVLLIFCPPGPAPRTNRSTTSFGRTPTALRRSTIWVGMLTAAGFSA